VCTRVRSPGLAPIAQWLEHWLGTSATGVRFSLGALDIVVRLYYKDFAA
jgi:hypothetical protein